MTVSPKKSVRNYSIKKRKRIFNKPTSTSSSHRYSRGTAQQQSTLEQQISINKTLNNLKTMKQTGHH